MTLKGSNVYRQIVHGENARFWRNFCLLKSKNCDKTDLRVVNYFLFKDKTNNPTPKNPNALHTNHVLIGKCMIYA